MKARYLWIPLVIAVAGGGLFTKQVIDRYNQSVHWANSTPASQADLPPEFVSNYTDDTLGTLQQAFADVNKQLTSVTDDPTKEWVTASESALSRATTALEKANIDKTKLSELLTRLKGYIDAWHVLDESTQKLMVDELQSSLTHFNNEYASHQRPVDKSWLAKLENRVDLYDRVATVMDEFWHIGLLGNDLFSIKPNVDATTVSKLKSEFEAVKDFELVKPYIELLSSDNMSAIVKNNNELYNKNMWDNAKLKLTALKSVVYVDITTLKTLKDLKDKQITYKMPELKPGEMLEDDSPVSKLMVGDEIISGNVYVKKSMIKAEITPYIKQPQRTTEQPTTQRQTTERPTSQTHTEQTTRRNR